MDYLTVIARTPGGRDEEETYSYEEFFELIVECAADKQTVARAIEAGELKVHELFYLWEDDPGFARWASSRVDALSEPNPELPYEASRCQAVTFTFAARAAEFPTLADFTQGVSFHKKDLEKAQLSVRGIGRGKLEASLWEFLLSLPTKENTRYVDFHLGNRVDQYEVSVEGPALKELFERISRSSYRSAKEMREYLLYHRPEQVQLTYSCTRA